VTPVSSILLAGTPSPLLVFLIDRPGQRHQKEKEYDEPKDTQSVQSCSHIHLANSRSQDYGVRTVSKWTKKLGRISQRLKNSRM
jgi:hypothetical protein